MAAKTAPSTPPHDILSANEHLESARLLVTPASHRVFYRIVMGTLIAVVLAMFLPWQQFIEGKGEVTAFSPADRPQVVPSTIAGRIVEWYVQEGQVVKAGDPLMRIAEVKDDYLDPRTIDRYNEQLTGKSSAVQSKREKVRQLGLQVELMERNQRLSEQKARTKVAQYEADVRAAVTDSATALAQLQRAQALLEQELVRLTDVENARVKYQNTVAKLQEKRQALQAAQIELAGVPVEYGEKIAKARSEAAATMAEVGEGSADVAKLRQNVSNLEIRNGFHVIRAPQGGTVVRAARAGIGEQLKEGETVVTIMPDAAQQAVALLVKPMDVPLLSIGRKVRLQFDGWPALQFAGWPSVSVGTFGGTVAVIDRVPDAAGQFRILVVPDSTDEAWPTQLRLGSGVLGWAMLDEVRVGFEIWRRINGFPPSLRKPSDDSFGGAKDGEKPAGKK